MFFLVLTVALHLLQLCNCGSIEFIENVFVPQFVSNGCEYAWKNNSENENDILEQSNWCRQNNPGHCNYCHSMHYLSDNNITCCCCDPLCELRGDCCQTFDICVYNQTQTFLGVEYTRLLNETNKYTEALIEGCYGSWSKYPNSNEYAALANDSWCTLDDSYCNQCLFSKGGTDWCCCCDPECEVRGDCCNDYQRSNCYVPDPTRSPTNHPTNNPTINPSINPSINPTNNPTNIPSNQPTNLPSKLPTNLPTNYPTNNPTIVPTNSPITQSPTSKSDKILQARVVYTLQVDTADINGNVCKYYKHLITSSTEQAINNQNNVNLKLIDTECTITTTDNSTLTFEMALIAVSDTNLEIDEITHITNNAMDNTNGINNYDINENETIISGNEKNKSNSDILIIVFVICGIILCLLFTIVLYYSVYKRNSKQQNNNKSNTNMEKSNELATIVSDTKKDNNNSYNTVFLNNDNTNTTKGDTSTNSTRNKALTNIDDEELYTNNQNKQEEMLQTKGNDNNNIQIEGGNDNNIPTPGITNTNDVKLWDTTNVKYWLINTVKLTQYVSLFENNYISGKHLLKLNDNYLKDIGITAVAHRMDILECIQKLKYQE